MANCYNDCIHCYVCQYVNHDEYPTLRQLKDDCRYCMTAADVVPKSEVDRLEYTLLGVMHSVDKWLEGDELEQDEVNRAATMREKTLQIIENAKTEVEELIYKLECLLCHATGSRLSKHTYDLSTMETVVTDYINQSYEDGYKDGASEVAMEIFEEIECAMGSNYYADSNSDYPIPYYYEDLREDIAELKKKYTEGTK